MTVLQNFKYTTAKKPGDSNGRVQFSTDGANFVNYEGDSLDIGGYSFDGVDDYISTPEVLNGATAMTFISRVRFNSLSSTYSLYGAALGPVSRVQIFTRTDGTIDVILGSGSGTISFTNNSGDSLKTGEWQTVAVVYTGTELISYIDGIEANRQSVSTITISTSGNHYIGAINTGSPVQDMAGDVSETLIYSRALSQTEIQDYDFYSIYPSSTNLESHYKLNGNALDETANNNDGTVVGATSITDWASLPPIGHSLIETDDTQVSSFDGVDDSILIPNTSAHSFGDASTDSPFSLSANVKMVDATNFRFLSKANNASTSNWEYIWVVNGSDLLYLILYDSTSSVFIGRYVTAAVTQYEGMHTHFGATYDGSGTTGGIKLYINGIEQASTAITAGSYTAMHNTSYGVTLGRSYVDYAEGILSNVAIWSDVRTSSEMLQEALNGYADTTDGNIVSYWPLAGDYEDKVGGHDGTNSGSTITKDVLRPQPEVPIQETIDISALGNQTSFFYRTFFQGTGANTFALDEITLQYGDGFIQQVVWM